MDEESIDLKVQRITDCEVCAKNEAKYTCPRCEVRSCCLACITIHKKELECSGIRDKVKFKRVKNLDNMDLLNDYRLLEETARLVNQSVKLPPESCYNSINGCLPIDLYRLKCTALSRGTNLYFLPPSFSRHATNTSYLNHESQELYWRVNWVFAQAENLTITDERVLDSSVLAVYMHKYIEPEDMPHPSLSFYQAAGHSGIKLLLKAERTAPNRYHLLDPTATLRENLKGKSIIEFPVIYAVLNDHIYMYNILTEEEEHKLRRNRTTYRRIQNSRRRKPTKNFLFSNNMDVDGSDSDKELSGNEEHETVEDSNDCDPFKQQRNLFHRGRGRGRWRGRGQNHFRNGRSFRGGHRRVRSHNKNDGAFSEQAINGGLSNHMNSVNIKST